MISLGVGRVQEQEERGRRELTTKAAVSRSIPGKKKGKNYRVGWNDLPRLFSPVEAK
jgi:hypothetical protein